jgi:predicted acylesterase/phospholipase RssA
MTNRAESRVGICLSGGGYRAALFHLGALRRLHEVGVLQQITDVSSVSGGSLRSALWSEFTSGETLLKMLKNFSTAIKSRFGSSAVRQSSMMFSENRCSMPQSTVWYSSALNSVTR